MTRGPAQYLVCCLGILPIALMFGSAPLAGEEYTLEEREHWSFLPRVEADFPTFSGPEDRRWTRGAIDAFILAEQRSQGLRPAPEADRAILVRRLFFQVTGLPPSPAAINVFADDPAPDA